MKLRVKHKLILLALLPLIVTTGMAISAYWQLEKVTETSQKLTEERLKPIWRLNRIARLYTQHVVDVAHKSRSQMLLWETIMAAGMEFGLKPGHTSSIRRVEGGMLSYHADADMSTDPFELGFDRLVNLDMEADFIGKAALRRIKEEGVSRKQIGLIIDGAPLTGPNTTFWEINLDGEAIGKVTSAVYSPRLEQNIALAMVSAEHAKIGAQVEVITKSGPIGATICERPFYDPKKQIAAA